MEKKSQVPQLSPCISDVCSMMENSAKDYTWSENEVLRMDKLTQDYLHALELNNLDYKQRAKVATQLKKCRQLRRWHKDTVEILEPLVTYLNTERGKNFINLLHEVLGKTRKAEEHMNNRVYFPRVLETAPIIKKE